MGVTGFDSVFLSLIGFDEVVLGFYWISIRFSWVFIEFYRISLGCTGFYWAR